MVYAHLSNIETKITKNYNNLADSIRLFRAEKYDVFRRNIDGIRFTDDYDVFVEATRLINEYRTELKHFASDNSIDAHSKFESSFLEEINAYLFKELPQILDRTYEVYNAKVYKDLKILETLEPIIATKNVDFCIGKKVTLTLGEKNRELIIPKVCVEVKTYLDSTMLGEVTASSRMIKNANPDAHTYVLAGYKSVADAAMLVAEKEAALDDIFVLQEADNQPIDPRALYFWWKEINEVMNSERENAVYGATGRMFRYLEEYRAFVETHPIEEVD